MPGSASGHRTGPEDHGEQTLRARRLHPTHRALAPRGSGRRQDNRIHRTDTVFGSRYLLVQTLLMLTWIVLNLFAVGLRWDPYPFILLNLAFSTQASYTAPLILLAQNRQEKRSARCSKEIGGPHRAKATPSTTPASWQRCGCASAGPPRDYLRHRNGQPARSVGGAAADGSDVAQPRVADEAEQHANQGDYRVGHCATP